MSPTSCRCSTPRRACGSRRRDGVVVGVGGAGAGPRDREGASASSVCPRAPGRTRGGLASRGVAPAVLSGAAAGHDRVRDGTGWDRRAPGHGSAQAPGPEGSSSLPRPRGPAPAPPTGRHDCSLRAGARTWFARSVGRRRPPRPRHHTLVHPAAHTTSRCDDPRSSTAPRPVPPVSSRSSAWRLVWRPGGNGARGRGGMGDAALGH